MLQIGLFLNYQTFSDFVPEAYARDMAIKKFDRAYTRGWFHKLWRSLTHRPRHLLTLKEIEASIAINNRHYEGIWTVALDQIRGSENRCRDFDDRFNPIQQYNEERWIDVATAMQQGKDLPPVELIKIGEIYFVRDGHHRISVARALGRKDIEASVIEWSLN